MTKEEIAAWREGVNARIDAVVGLWNFRTSRPNPQAVRDFMNVVDFVGSIIAVAFTTSIWLIVLSAAWDGQNATPAVFYAVALWFAVSATFNRYFDAKVAQIMADALLRQSNAICTYARDGDVLLLRALREHMQIGHTHIEIKSAATPTLAEPEQIVITTIPTESAEILEILSQYRSQQSRVGAQKRHAKDPKQADKALVRECWDDWQKQPDRYKGKAAFARDMRDKFPNLQSIPVIEGWCRVWEGERTT